MSRFVTGLLTGALAAATAGLGALAVHENLDLLEELTWHGRDTPPQAITVVLQRDGGRVYAGPDDVPGLHLSGILARQGIATADIPAYRGGDARWNRLKACVQDRFDGLGVTIVDEPPTEGEYTLAFVGGTPDLLGYPKTVGGIAPHADRVLEGSVLFVFTPRGVSERALCETAAHEIGHTLGLDHSRDCTDIMSYETCGPKEFRTTAAHCGEWEARLCEDGGSTQSSRDRLARAVGVRSPRTTPPPTAATSSGRPTIEVRRSADAIAGAPFSIYVDAGEADVQEAEVYWYARRGMRLRCGHEGPIPFECERRGSTYVFTVHPSSAGPRKFFARVTDSTGRRARTPAFDVRVHKSK